VCLLKSNSKARKFVRNFDHAYFEPPNIQKPRLEDKHNKKSKFRTPPYCHRKAREEEPILLKHGAWTAETIDARCDTVTIYHYELEQQQQQEEEEEEKNTESE
jgi:hypothetical protein